MTWDYRVVRTVDGYAIYEVYDDGGRPEARTEDPASPFGETLEELAEDVRYYLAALQQPVLDDARFHRGRARPFGADDEGCSGHEQTASSFCGSPPLLILMAKSCS